MSILRRYRFLLVICGLAMILALWEPSGRMDDQEEVLKSIEAKTQTVKVLSEKYFDDEEVVRMIAISLAKKGELAEARKYFEQALASGVKTNEDNFYLYAVTLVALGSPEEEVEKAIADWKFNFPFSNRPDPRDKQALSDFLRLPPPVVAPGG